MAVVNRKSAAVTNETASPKVINNPSASAARLHEVANVITPAADDTSASIGRFHRIPSNARVSQFTIDSSPSAEAKCNFTIHPRGNLYGWSNNA